MLKEQLQSDTNDSLKQGNHEVTGVLRLALAAIGAKEKEKRYKISKEYSEIKEEELILASALTDDEVIGVLSQEIKKRKDAIALYEKGNRPELVKKETSEILVLQKYLPEQLPEAELKKIIEESIKKVRAVTVKDTGKIMADLMPKVRGRADNTKISSIIKEFFNHG